MDLDDPLNNEQAQCSNGDCMYRRTNATERFEDELPVFRRDAYTIIGDRDSGFGGPPFKEYVDVLSCRRILDRIADQIDGSQRTGAGLSGIDT